MDITSAFVEILETLHSSSASSPKRQSQQSDGFLKEAESISAHITSLHHYLQSIRQSYLSTAQPLRRADLSSNLPTTVSQLAGGGRRQLSDAQRDQIDAESKQVLRDMNRAIQRLSETEQLRQQAEARLAQHRRTPNRFGALKSWAGGRSETDRTPVEEIEDARVSTVKLHREGMMWYLRRQLEACSELQMTMMETRLVRELEKGKSRLYNARGMTTMSMATELIQDTSLLGRGAETYAGSTDSRARRVSQLDNSPTGTNQLPLTTEQLQVLAEENADMLKHYEDTLDQVRTAERSLIEISELQTTLANNLAVQSAHIDQLVADTQYTSENVGGGNKQLKRAAERTSTAKYVFYVACSFSLFLITYDFLI